MIECERCKNGDTPIVNPETGEYVHIRRGSGPDDVCYNNEALGGKNTNPTFVEVNVEFPSGVHTVTAQERRTERNYQKFLLGAWATDDPGEKVERACNNYLRDLAYMKDHNIVPTVDQVIEMVKFIKGGSTVSDDKKWFEGRKISAMGSPVGPGDPPVYVPEPKEPEPPLPLATDPLVPLGWVDWEEVGPVEGRTARIGMEPIEACYYDKDHVDAKLADIGIKAVEAVKHLEGLGYSGWAVEWIHSLKNEAK